MRVTQEPRRKLIHGQIGSDSCMTWRHWQCRQTKVEVSKDP